MRIVLGDSSMAGYLRGGGHWTVMLQYLLGLRDLGHDVLLLELMEPKGDPSRDERRIAAFFARLARYGLEDCGALLLLESCKSDPGSQTLEVVQDIDTARVYGKTLARIKELIKNADMVWNNCCGIRQPLLGMFKHRVLIDLDPGLLQISALSWNMDIPDHQAFLSVGGKMNDADCEVPTLGVKWRTFLPFVYLPMWDVKPDPGHDRPFSSVTHWSWGELWWDGRVFSISKRDGYLPFIDLPVRTARTFELAVRFKPTDESGDRESLVEHGWNLVDPWEVVASPADYQAYIAESRAEISCAKPIFRDLKTGWFSDRSACYLASGRPVLAQDTGFSERLPTGKGLVTFRTLDEAVAGVAEIDARYPEHMRAARELAEEFLDSRRCLADMLSVCG